MVSTNATKVRLSSARPVQISAGTSRWPDEACPKVENTVPSREILGLAAPLARIFLLESEQRLREEVKGGG